MAKKGIKTGVLVKYLPCLVSGALIGVAKSRQIRDKKTMRLAAGSFRDLSGGVEWGNPGQMVGWCRENREELLEWLGKLKKELRKWEKFLRRS